jgi:hypothetical protein
MLLLIRPPCYHASISDDGFGYLLITQHRMAITQFVYHSWCCLYSVDNANYVFFHVLF